MLQTLIYFTLKYIPLVFILLCYHLITIVYDAYIIGTDLTYLKLFIMVYLFGVIIFIYNVATNKRRKY